MNVTCDAGNAITLPDATEVSVGEDFLIRNVGANLLSIKDASGAQIASVVAGAASYFYVTDNSTPAGAYGAIAFGVGTSSIDAGSLVGYGIKALGASLNQAHSVVTTSSNTAIAATHRALLLVFIGGAGTFSLPDALATGDDFFTLIRNSGTGTLTIDAAGSDLIDSQTSLTVQPGESLMVFCSGSAWYSVGYGRSIAYQFSQLVKDVTAGGTITLTTAEASNKLITFIGSPAANLTVVVPPVAAVYYTYNAISTAFSVTFKTAAGLGAAIPQSGRSILLCDGTDVLSAQSFTANTTLSVLNGTVSLPSINFASQPNTGIYKVGGLGWGVSVNGVSVFELENTRALLNLPQDYVRLKLNAASPIASEGSFYYNSTTKKFVYNDNAGAVSVASLASPAFTGNPTAPTPTPGDNDTSIATTAFVQATLGTFAPVNSPTFTGTPLAPTAVFGTNTQQIATTAGKQYHSER